MSVKSLLGLRTTYATRIKLMKIKVQNTTVFVVNDTKELSEIRQSWLYNSVTVISCWAEIFLHYNYWNIDAISRHLVTAGLLCVYVFVIFHIFFILCTYLYAVYHLPCDRWIKITNRIQWLIQTCSEGRTIGRPNTSKPITNAYHYYYYYYYY